MDSIEAVLASDECCLAGRKHPWLEASFLTGLHRNRLSLEAVPGVPAEPTTARLQALTYQALRDIPVEVGAKVHLARRLRRWLLKDGSVEEVAALVGQQAERLKAVTAGTSVYLAASVLRLCCRGSAQRAVFTRQRKGASTDAGMKTPEMLSSTTRAADDWSSWSDSGTGERSTVKATPGLRPSCCSGPSGPSLTT